MQNQYLCMCIATQQGDVEYLTSVSLMLQKRIVMLSQEMEAAKSAHAQRIQDESARRANIINSKLKQKSQDL